MNTLENTSPLMIEGDIADRLVEGVDQFLLDQLEKSISERAKHWDRKSIKPNRKRLAHILGVRDDRKSISDLRFLHTTSQSSKIAESENFEAHEVKWEVLHNICGYGLLITPKGRKQIADIIAIPDADQSPIEFLGSNFVSGLAENGCRVVIPDLISRQKTINQISKREWLYRSAYELGRHLIGYELQKIFSIIDWFGLDQNRIGVFGWGEGGMIAFYAAAIDERIDVACVSGYFNSRQEIWKEPIERNVFGLLEQFGDAEIATMIAPRTLIVEAGEFPKVVIPPGTGGAAPAELTTPDPKIIEAEINRAKDLLDGFDLKIESVTPKDQNYGSPKTLDAFSSALRFTAKNFNSEPQKFRDASDHDDQMFAEIDQFNQWLLRESAYVRKDFFAKLEIDSIGHFNETIEPYRDFFAKEVIGEFEIERLPFNPRVRKSHEDPNWIGYEVVIDVFTNVIAYGILLLPKDLKNGDRRSVVVCQHGLEGRPQNLIEGDRPSYHDFAAKLAERGYITFSPQNLYIFGDRFRSLQRKAYPLKKTLFSIIVPQHQQITDWLKTLSCVDPDRIAFYGLSYGGKTAMRVPPLVKNYCLSICSADFNEWIWKNASSRSKYSYVRTGEYEIFEFDLGSTFNYAEMSWLVCPRPFMVERGHFDGVAPDEAVAYEYAKTQRVYDLLGIGDRTEMEVFNGPHTINGVGTFEFLDKHLRSEID